MIRIRTLRPTAMPQLKIPTKHGDWVVPEHFEIVKLMISQRQLHASDLRFDTSTDCQNFTKRLALLALADECKNNAPSIIALLSRRLVALNSASSFSTQR